MMFRGAPAFYFHVGTDFTVGSATEAFTYEDLVTAARHVAWHFTIGELGEHYPPGDMLRSVLDAMGRADPGNMARLCRAFPLHGALMRGIRDDDLGTRSMILNLLKYHTAEGWTEPTTEPTPADTGDDEILMQMGHTDTCDRVVTGGTYDCSCNESETP